MYGENMYGENLYGENPSYHGKETGRDGKQNNGEVRGHTAQSEAQVNGHEAKACGHRQSQTGRDACGLPVLWFFLYFVRHFVYSLSLLRLSRNIGSGVVGGDDRLPTFGFQKAEDRKEKERMVLFRRMGTAFRQ